MFTGNSITEVPLYAASELESGSLHKLSVILNPNWNVSVKFIKTSPIEFQGNAVTSAHTDALTKHGEAIKCVFVTFPCERNKMV